MLESVIGMVKNRLNREAVYSAPEYWDSKAAQYSGHAVSMWPNNNLNALYHAEQLEVLEAAFGNLSGKAALDVGCGTGRTSRWLASRGAQVVGLDFSEKSIALAQQQGTPGNPVYRRQSMLDIDDVERFDVAVCWGSLTVACRSATDLADVMHRLHRALRPQGTFFALEPVHKGFLHRVLDMDVDEFTAIMTGAGFRIDSLSRLHFWPARLALAFVPWPKWITVPAYHAGQAVMHVPGFRNMGDYTAIRATRNAERGA
jgi:SAM-dependent methyltransferase